MARRNQSERSSVDELFDLLLVVPAWVGPILAAVVFAVMRWVIPPLLAADSGSEFSRSGLRVIAQVMHGFAPWAGGLTLLVWIAAEIKKWMNRSHLDRQTGAASIRDLNWREFEALLAEAFRRQGFDVEHCGAAGPDGGIDLRLNKAGEITLVQCKHWKAQRVGVRIARELLGVVSSEGARSGIVVASGQFTPDAVEFAEKNPIRLIDGGELAAMIGQVQKPKRMNAPTHPREADAEAHARAEPVKSSTEVKCPTCGSPMVRRVARKGANAGTEFLGCSRYPSCRKTLELTASRA